MVLQYLDFGSMILISDFCPPDLREVYLYYVKTSSLWDIFFLNLSYSDLLSNWDSVSLRIPFSTQFQGRIASEFQSEGM